MIRVRLHGFDDTVVDAAREAWSRFLKGEDEKRLKLL